jgi:putative membrane protein
MPSERRLHPLSFLFELGARAKSLVVPAIAALFAARTGGIAWEIWAMVLLVPYAAAALGRALSFRYRLDEAELIVRSGFVFRRERHIPYDRIQNVEAVQGVVHRLLDVVTVRLETGGGLETDARLNVVSAAEFPDIRARIFAKGSTSIERDAAAPPEAGTEPLLAMPVREVLLWGFIRGQGWVVIGAGFGLLWEFGLVDRLADVVFGERGPGRGVLRQLVLSLVGEAAPPTRELALTAVAFAVLLVLARVLSMALAFARFYGFRLVRAGDDLRSEFGLFPRISASVPAHRIQTLTLHEGPLHRLFRRASVSVETAGGEMDQVVQEQRQWIAPLVRRGALLPLVRALLPVADIAGVGWQPVHPRAFRRALVGPLFVAVVLSASLVAVLGWWTLLAFGALLLWGAAAARLYVSRLRWVRTDRAVMFASGWLWRRVTVAPLAKIQAVWLRESPFDRRAKMATVAVDTAGAHDATHRVVIPFLPRDVAEELRSHLADAAARTQFRW